MISCGRQKCTLSGTRRVSELVYICQMHRDQPYHRHVLETHLILYLFFLFQKFTPDSFIALYL